MKTKIIVIVAVGFAIFACSNGPYSNSNDEISGAYVREYSFKVLNPETGIEIGMRTVRDTIFIRVIENGYEVTNRKWRLNDYGKEGWQSEEHSEARPLPTYNAKLIVADSTLNSDQPKLIPPLYIDFSKRTIHKSKGEKQEYIKIFK